MTKKELGLRDDFYSFPTCPKCHKLYNKQKVEDYKENDTNSIMKFLNISSEDEMEEMEEMEEISIESEEELADEFSNIFEDYSSSNYDPDEPINPKSTNNNSYLWILL
ncbi:hypothetical protein Glove_102g70 [Diversispora epigaea]|uniref:Uncharacterized protein n=1 Tax=Diversispora epigaea TaxID=1348612 RepID=A0A397JCN1_9GLOM|nr:hypothetical protein Glove_102g70 [Diversispora epigaea]